jgi:hypothetical protein
MRPPSRTNASHVYHLSTPRLLVLPAVWALIMAALLLPLASATATDPRDAHALGWASALFTLILLPFAALTWHARLVLTPEGIAHHQLGYTVRSPWPNLVSLDLTAGCEALHLDQPGTHSRLLRWSTQVAAGAAPRMTAGLFGDANALAQGRLILLAPFMQHWRRGPLQDDLRRWAPHLFRQGPAAA